MNKLVPADINTFGPTSPKANFVPQSEQLITVTIGQLQDFVTQAIEKAVQPLKDRIESLEDRISDQDEKIASLTTTQELDAGRLCLDIALDRQRITKLEQQPAAVPRGEKTIARIAKINEVLKVRGATTLKMLEGILRIDRSTMTRLLGKLDKRRYELHPRPDCNREKILRLKLWVDC